MGVEVVVERRPEFLRVRRTRELSAGPRHATRAFIEPVNSGPPSRFNLLLSQRSS